MKYYNKEYGFEGRPPELLDYKQESNVGPVPGPENFPNKTIVGMGLYKDVPNGVLLVGEKGSMWGVRISYQRNNGKWIDSQEFLTDMGNLYTSNHDGSFSYFSHGVITATAAKCENGIALSIASMSNSKVKIIFYPIAPEDGEYISAKEREITGSSSYYAIFQGKSYLSEEGCVFKKRYDAMIDGKQKKEFFRAVLYSSPNYIREHEGKAISYDFEFSNNNNSRLFIFAAVGDKDIITQKTPAKASIIEVISRAELEYSAHKSSGSGSLAGAVDQVCNSAMWHRIYNPYMLDCAFFDTRTEDEARGSPGYYLYSNVSFNTAALVGAYATDGAETAKQLPYAANDRLTSVITAWITFSRHRNIDMLKTMFREYKKIILPDSEIIMSGADKKEVAYRMPGSPMKEIDRAENMYSLDLSCMKLLEMDLLERMALLLEDEIAKEYAKAKKNLTVKINETFYNAELGIYMNKYESGVFAESIGATSLYPLLCGVVKDIKKVEEMISYLNRNKKLDGEVIFPTITRDNTQYGMRYRNQDGQSIKPYENFSGEIIPYINYFIYLGIVRYGLEEWAVNVSEKCVKLFLREYGKGHAGDAYLPSGKLSSTASKQSLMGSLLGVIGMSELIDAEYFRDDLKPALKFGTLARGDHTAMNIKLLGRTMSISASSSKRVTSLEVDGREVLSGEGGKFAVRQLVESENSCEFIISTDGEVKMEMHFPLLLKHGNKRDVVFNIRKGKHKVTVSGTKVDIAKIIQS